MTDTKPENNKLLKSKEHQQKQPQQVIKQVEVYNSGFNIAINGFGRIGRNVLRAMLHAKQFFAADIKLVAINDVADAHTLLHLLKYDSTYGRLSDMGFDASIEQKDNQFWLIIHDLTTKESCQIALINEPQPTYIPWQNFEVDMVLECTGHFRSYIDASSHLIAGAKQVIIGAAPFDDVDACIVMGVNDGLLKRDLKVVSSVSCTTQALVPLIHTLDKAFGVNSAMMTEIHAITADQNVLDQVHRDPRRARASGYNIIPTTSSSIAATERVLPHMAGLINGYSMRVPTIDVAAIDVTFLFKKQVNLQQVKSLLQTASNSELKGIMDYTNEPLVSSDFVQQKASLIVDELQLIQVGDQIKVFAWYDNEWGYANRLVEMCQKLAKIS